MTQAGYVSSFFAAAAIVAAPLLTTSTGCVPDISQGADSRDQTVKAPSGSPIIPLTTTANQPKKQSQPTTSGETASTPQAISEAFTYANRHQGVAILVFQGKEDVQAPYEKGALFMRGLARRGIAGRIFVKEIDHPRGGIEFLVNDHDRKIDTATTLLVANVQLDTERKVREAFQQVLDMFHEAYPSHTLHLTQD